MEEITREYGEILRNVACDCCGRWIIKGSEATLVAYRVAAQHHPELGKKNLHFEWFCPDCEGVGQ